MTSQGHMAGAPSELDFKPRVVWFHRLSSVQQLPLVSPEPSGDLVSAHCMQGAAWAPGQWERVMRMVREDLVQQVRSLRKKRGRGVAGHHRWGKELPGNSGRLHLRGDI